MIKHNFRQKAFILKGIFKPKRIAIFKLLYLNFKENK